MKLSDKSIIYVNFAPYENAGSILEFLLNEFNIVVLISFNFHRLNNSENSNLIRVYKKGKIKEEIKLYRLPTPESLLFISLPIINILIALQTLWYVWKLRGTYGTFDVYMTVNAFTAWLGNILRYLKVVKKTVFWVWDYYPPGYPDFVIRFARWGYWRFDSASTQLADRVVFLNKKLLDLRKDLGLISKNKKYPIVPIGTKPYKTTLKYEPIIGHLGVLKKSQGLDIIFDNYEAIIKKYPKMRMEIIGSGPDEQYFKERAKNKQNVRFYGYVKNEKKVNEIVSRWIAGTATYIPESSNPAYWTDPSKIKLYISLGVPVLVTSITPFSQEIKESRAGVIVDYFEKGSFVRGLTKITNNSLEFRKNAQKLSQRYTYKSLYNQLFTSLR